MNAPRIAAVHRAVPTTTIEQDAALAQFLAISPRGEAARERIEQLFRATGVKKRHIAIPAAEYAHLDDFAKKNAVWARVALDLGAEAVSGALEAAGLAPRDVDHIFFTTVTGIAVPSIDARLVNRLGFRKDVKRSPLFGLGCVAGVSGTARAADYLRGAPNETAILLAVELCTLTLQRGDASIANIIASGLFGDGASAVVLRGGGPPTPPPREAGGGLGPRVVASRAAFYPGTEDAMGWEIVEGGFKVILSGAVPELARDNIAKDVDAFLASLELDRSAIKHWVCHTGGPKVLMAFEEALALPRSALARSWRSLEETGNLSSVSVLLVLEDLLASGEARPGDRGLMLAMGPGFCAELVLLEW